LSVRMGQSWYNEFQDLYDKFDSMSDHIQELVAREYELKILGTQAELKQLQYQISPHFLYNTYFILCGLLQEEEIEQAMTLSDTMGRFLHYITNSHTDHAYLKEEVQHACAYSEIQQIRYSNRVKMEFNDCPERYHYMKVPRLIIQPLIENAFEHGMKNVRKNGVVRISFRSEETCFIVIVEDNGDDITEDEVEKLNLTIQESKLAEEHGIALYNIHQRIKMTFGRDSGLSVTRSPLGGLSCQIKIEVESEHSEPIINC
jgi:two-component system sensor histidine kinase YesM